MKPNLNPSLSEEKKFELLNLHYEDTNRTIREVIKTRDRFLFYIFIILGLMTFQIFDPILSKNLISQYLSNALELQIPAGVSFISTLAWSALLIFSLRYFQAVINLENLYDYVQSLENLLSKPFNQKVFIREGINYLKNYPIFLTWSHIFYRFFLPLLLIVAVVIKIVSECKAAINPLQFFNITLASVILISIVLYMIRIHFKK